MDYIPPKRDPRYLWLKKISDNVVAEAVKIGAPATDALAFKAAADHLLGKMEATDAAASALDGARNEEAMALAADSAIIRALVRNWKTLTGYPTFGSEAVLALKGSSPPLDPANYKPIIKVKIEAGQIRFDFERLGVDALAFYCRLRGTLVWRKIGMDTYPPYYDSAPLAQPGVAEVREYMARGVIGDGEVGLDSDIVSIAFGG